MKKRKLEKQGIFIGTDLNTSLVHFDEFKKERNCNNIIIGKIGKGKGFKYEI